jgi:hypothetical protein
LSGTINNNQNTVTINGVTYSKAESGVILTATRTSGVNLTAGNSAPFTVNAGTASRLVITGSATQTAGTSQNLTITAEDASGNTVTSYTGPKLLTFSGASASSNPVTQPTVTNNTGTAVNFGTATMITFTSGVATVSGSSNGSMTLYKVETANIAATDGTIPASTGADRLTVTVSAGNLAKFALSLTSPQANGAVFTGANTLTAQDSWGNTVTSFDAATDNVAIVANAPLVGTVSGLGSGGNNVLNQAGNFVSGVANLTLGMKYTGSLATGTFTATSASGKTGTSGNVTINAGTATQVRVETAADGSGTVVPAQTVNSGSSITVFSISRDTSGNFVANVAASSWSLVSITGGVVAGDLVPAVGNKSAVFTGHAAGTAAIHATSGALTTTDSGTITVGAGTATRLGITGSATQTAGTFQNLTITAKDASGNTVTSYTGDKSLTFSGANPSTNPVTNPTVTDKTGTAKNFGTATTITFTNGVATVSGSSSGSMTLYKAETAIIAANDGAGASSTGADRLTVTVSAGNLAKFALSLISPQANGAVFTGANTLTAQDTWGNTVTNFDASTDNVTIVANAPLVGTVSGLGSGGNNVLNQAGNFVSGVANLTTSGMKYTGSLATGTLTATSASGKTGTSGNVTINVGALDHFKVEAAGGGPIGMQTQNAAFNIMVTAQDAGNNTVTSFSGTGSGGTVMLTSTGTLLGGPSVQTTAFTNGVLSTFSVTITNSGTFTITAAGFGGNAGKTGTSNSFTVNPATVDTTTTVTSSSNPSTYGANVTFTATVNAAPSTNNPTGTVTFTIDGTPGSPVSLGACSPAVAGTACASTSTSTLTVLGSPHTVSASYSPGTDSVPAATRWLVGRRSTRPLRQRHFQ